MWHQNFKLSRNPNVLAEGGDNCPIFTCKDINICIRHRPANTLADESKFYWRPLPIPTGEIWYSQQTVGRDKLGKMIKSMEEKCKLESREVNHSRRKTFATTDSATCHWSCSAWDWNNISTLSHYSVRFRWSNKMRLQHMISGMMSAATDKIEKDSFNAVEQENSMQLVSITNNACSTTSNTNMHMHT